MADGVLLVWKMPVLVEPLLLKGYPKIQMVCQDLSGPSYEFYGMGGETRL
jgi:hypothetical protein